MNRAEMYADVRRKIGGQTRNEVTDRELEPYIVAALEWLANELRYRVVTEENAIALVSGQFEYPLPDDVVEIIDLFWDEKRLTSNSVDAWSRLGTDYRHVSSSEPREHAVEGRRLFLTPPPSATAVTTDGALTLRYAATPAAIPAGGPHELPPLDHRLAAWEAALEWLLVHPSEENNARAQGYATQITRLLPGARRRAQQPIRDYRPRWRVQVYRSGSAR